jgi:hypothetical protein
MKKFILGFIIGIIISTSVFARTVGLYKGFEKVKLFVDGKELTTTQPSIIIDGNVYSPIKEVSSTLGGYFSYNNDTHEANVRNSILVYPTQIKIDSKQPKSGNIVLEIDENNKCSEIYVGLKIIQECVSGYKFDNDNSLTILTVLQSKDQTPPVANTQSGSGVFSKLNEKKSVEKVFYLYADDEDHTYLGKITSNDVDSDSIFNTLGKYGSKYQSNSIWNTYGTFGGEYSKYSPFNEYTRTPPIIKDENGKTIGRLTVNEYVSGAISPYEVKSLLNE